MATEELIVKLDAKTAKLDAKLKKSTDGLEKLENKTNRADGGLKKLGGGAKIAGAAILKTAVAAAALAAAVSTMVISSANGRRELELLAKQAKTSAQDFQALSFATSRYGINAEQIADISKDIADKVGEFSAAGTGAFQDYIDVMKITKDEARAAAREFEGLSSQEILGTMVSRMEEANVSGDKMTFVLESLGNDASRLIPLFKGNSKELLELKKRFNDVNDSLQITGTQAAALQDVSNTFTLMTSSMGNASTAISATLAPVLDDFFNDIIEIVPDATQTIIDFVNSFLDAEDIKSVAAAQKRISDSEEKISGLTDQVNDKRQRGKTLILSNLRAEKLILEDLKAQLTVLQEQEQSLENANRLKGGKIGGEGGDPLPEGGLGTIDEIQEIEDRFKLEEELLAEKLARELEMIGENLELRRKLTDAFASDVQIMEVKREKERGKELKTEKKDEKDRYDYKIDQASGFVYAAQILNSTIGGDNKILAAGLIVADTATAVMKSLSMNPYDYANVAVLVATGIAQLANVGSSSPSGAASGGSGGSSIGPQQSREPDFVQESSSLEFTDTTDSGAATFNLTVPDGDEIGEAIANWLSKAQNEGRV
tara:strand:- start:894 stop:2693 length:1800 start_codon:yes stop_codon:yes gene_type:complete